MIEVKQKLYASCKEFVNNKLQTIEATVRSNKNALESETKSSAGDKHETGRAMLQLEMEKAGQQLKEVQQMQLVLEKMDISKESKLVCLGTVVQTTQANYFIAISVGKIINEGVAYYAISPNSPIGKLLLGKHLGESYSFQGKILKIENVY
jgi:transcription elongation GreA/GreB family factor